MKLEITPSQVELIPTTMKEIHALEKFPGFVGRGKYLMANKPPVLRNILSRLPADVVVKLPPDLLEKTTLKEVSPNFPFHTTPLRHQMIALRYLITNRGGGLLLDPGLGKTKIALDYIFYSRFKRVLIICPKPLMFVWEDEIATHRPELSFTTFNTTEWADHADLTKRVWIMNYRKAVMLLPDIMDTQFDAIFIDEGLVKNPSSDQTTAITLLSKLVPVRVIMSGTLVNNSEIDLFAPVRILEPSLVGGSYTAFRDQYFHVWSPNKADPNIKAVSGAKDKDMMRGILRSCSLIMRKEEWLELPEKTFIEREVEMPPMTAKHYYELLSNYVTRIDKLVIECENPLALMCKLSQISNGFLYENEDGFDELMIEKPPRKKGTRAKKGRPTFFFPHQPKIQELQKILLVDEPEERIIVWYTMSAERDMIESMLTANGITFLTIAGGDKQLREKVREFNEQSHIKVLLCQAKTLNYGVTLLGNKGTEYSESEDDDVSLRSINLNDRICVQVFFSLTTSLEVFLQQQDRIHRIGQTKPCRYYMILSNSPVEQMLVSRLKDRIEIRQFMLEDILNKARSEFSYLASSS